jgi:uncharacterized damage-inducible protein DinB
MSLLARSIVIRCDYFIMQDSDNRTVSGVTADTLRTHLAYTAWADRRLLDAAARLSPEEVGRDFGTADRSVAGPLAHIFASTRAWLARIDGEPFPGPVPEADRNLVFLEREWPPLQERWRAWATRLTDEAAGTVISYHDMKGNPWQNPVWEILLHVVNHGTHHRGQISGFLRSMGHTPPPLDLIAYYRSLR